jgi:hypothetical protein
VRHVAFENAIVQGQRSRAGEAQGVVKALTGNPAFPTTA